MLLQVCLNGPRSAAEHRGVPVTPRALADAAVAACAAGARDVHLHPKSPAGADSVVAADVAAAVTAVRRAVPGVPVGVTTGAWAEPDPAVRVARVRSWTVLPDHASVNWHEPGADQVAAALLERGVGVEAGVWSGTDAVALFRASPLAPRVLRVLAEVTDTDPGSAPGTARELLTALAGAPARPVLLHGEDGGAWPVLRLAAGLGLATRIGLEDTLVLPDGTPAPGNAALVAAAAALLSGPPGAGAP